MNEFPESNLNPGLTLNSAVVSEVEKFASRFSVLNSLFSLK